MTARNRSTCVVPRMYNICICIRFYKVTYYACQFIMPLLPYQTSLIDIWRCYPYRFFNKVVFLSHVHVIKRNFKSWRLTNRNKFLFSVAIQISPFLFCRWHLKIVWRYFSRSQWWLSNSGVVIVAKIPRSSLSMSVRILTLYIPVYSQWVSVYSQWVSFYK